MENYKIKELAEKLSDKDGRVRLKASWDLMVAADNGADISIVFPDLIKAFLDRTSGVKNNSILALKKAAVGGESTLNVLQEFVKMLSNADADLRYLAVFALKNTADDGVDIFVAVPKLLELRNDADDNVRTIVPFALKSAARFLEQRISGTEDKKEVLSILRKFSFVGKEEMLIIYKIWSAEQNEKTGELQKPNLRKPQKNPANNLRKIVY
ncbi:hypothetical protein KAW38_01195 [Candidatus Micrarchaeota archaeon]|nr:hypothetical protein [Candidatus Micrarchaeota archaeon]